MNSKEIKNEIDDTYIFLGRLYILTIRKDDNMNKTLLRETNQQIAVDIERLSAMLSCGRATARKVGEQAEARICIGRRVLYSVDKVKQYLCNLSE